MTPELESSHLGTAGQQGWVCLIPCSPPDPAPGDVPSPLVTPRVLPLLAPGGRLGRGFSSKNRAGFVYQDLHLEFLWGMEPTVIPVTRGT